MTINDYYLLLFFVRFVFEEQWKKNYFSTNCEKQLIQLFNTLIVVFQLNSIKNNINYAYE